MARLVGQSDGFRGQVIELHLGLNRLGRSPENDFQIDHPSVSARHCEVLLGAHEVTVRDCESTNGTFVGGEQVHEATLQEGQILLIGDVELFVESTDARVAIPKFELPRAAPPIARPNRRRRHGSSRPRRILPMTPKINTRRHWRRPDRMSAL